MKRKLPRHVILKRLASGRVAFYYNVPTKYRVLKCPVANEPLGSDHARSMERADTSTASSTNGMGSHTKGLPVTSIAMPKNMYSVDWLFREYKISKAYLDKVAVRSRRDYEWAMACICGTITKKGRSRWRQAGEKHHAAGGRQAV